jgi:antitoxin HicB
VSKQACPAQRAGLRRKSFSLPPDDGCPGSFLDDFQFLPYDLGMKSIRYVPIQGEDKQPHFFRVELAKEKDGRWSAWAPSLPGCATWGYTGDEALRNIYDAIVLYVRDLHETGDEVPEDIKTKGIKEVLLAVPV